MRIAYAFIIMASTVAHGFAQNATVPRIAGEWQLAMSITPSGSGQHDSTWQGVVLEITENGRRFGCRLRWPSGDRVKCDPAQRDGNVIRFRIERSTVDALDGGREYDLGNTFEGRIGEDGVISGTRTAHPCDSIYDWSARKR